MRFFVGTSGYSYKEWKGGFYPEKLPQKQMLSYYAQRFGTVELNSTFRRMPSESSMQSWANQVPADFRFAIKAPQVITHFKRLKDVAEPTKELFHVAGALTTRLGPVLFGLPANFKKDVPRLRAFLKLIPRGRQAAFEFRHESWFDEEVFDCLRRSNYALCIADAEELPPARVVRTSTWTYVRLRRERYTKKALADWAQTLQSLAWKEAYVFFKHEDTGTGPKLAGRFLELAKG
jgi:uncharacterized protein YecE (DUF72 family)